MRYLLLMLGLWAKSLLIFAWLMVAGCVISSPADSRVYLVPLKAPFPQSLHLVTVDGHQYLFTRRGNAGGFVHKADCTHGSHR